LKGIPIRVEIGPRDLQQNKVVVVERLSGKKQKFDYFFENSEKNENFVLKIENLLGEIQSEMLARAIQKADGSIRKISRLEFCSEDINRGKIFAARFCETVECENAIKKSGLGKSLCIPFNQNGIEKCGESAKEFLGECKKSIIETQNDHHPISHANVVSSLPVSGCFACERPAKRWTLFGKSY